MNRCLSRRAAELEAVRQRVTRVCIPTMISLPRAFSKRITDVFGAQGEEWLKRLPEVISKIERQWSIKVGPPFPDLSYSYVAEVVTEDGTEAVLKLAVPTNDLACEVEALRVFRGEGAVTLIRDEPDDGALLLERAIPGSPLSSVPDDEGATAIGAQVMRSLSRPVPDGHPFPSVGDWAASLRHLRLRYDGGTGPLPAQLVQEAEGIFAELIPSMTRLVLLHGDLHHDNILAARRLPWMAIDPKGVVGEAEYDASSLLRNPLPRLLEATDPKRLLVRRLEILYSELGFSKDRLRGWALAQSVLSAWWAIEDHGEVWQEALDCAALLADLGR